MRTTIDIDDKLLEDARVILSAKTKKAVVEEALRELINTHRRQRLRQMIGSGATDMTLDDLWRMRGKG